MACTSITFADKTGAHHHADRFKILPWWERICAIVGRGPVASVARVKTTLETTVAWMRETMPRALARIVHALDCQGMNGSLALRSFVGDLVKRGERKLQFRPAPVLDQGLDPCCLFSI